MSKFAEDLSRMCAIELPHARRDADRLSDMIERLADSLALTIAIAGNGETQKTDKLYSGTEQFLLNRIADYGNVARKIAK